MGDKISLKNGKSHCRRFFERRWATCHLRVVEAVLWPEISKVRCDQMDLLCDANACAVAGLDPESYVRQPDHPPPNSASACALARRMDLSDCGIASSAPVNDPVISG